MWHSCVWLHIVFQRALYIKTDKHFQSHLTQFFLEWKIFQNKRCRENQNTHFVFSNYFFFKSCRLWDNSKKYCGMGQAADDNMMHCMLDTHGYNCTHRSWNSHCFTTATTVAQKHLKVTLHVRCPSSSHYHQYISITHDV